MKWLRNWLINNKIKKLDKEIATLRAELQKSRYICFGIYDYFWPKDEWVGWVNIDVRQMLSLTQDVKNYIYGLKKAGKK